MLNQDTLKKDKPLFVTFLDEMLHNMWESFERQDLINYAKSCKYLIIAEDSIRIWHRATLRNIVEVIIQLANLNNAIWIIAKSTYIDGLVIFRKTNPEFNDVQILNRYKENALEKNTYVNMFNIFTIEKETK